MFLRPPDVIIGPLDDPYLRRWHLIPHNKWLNVYLHNIVKDDDDRALHDHPWNSLSFLLAGDLREMTDNGIVHLTRRPKYRPGDYAHRLILSDSKPAWTLFITGPKIREWGFHCLNGWTHWTKYVELHDDGGSTTIGRGCGEQ